MSVYEPDSVFTAFGRPSSEWSPFTPDTQPSTSIDPSSLSAGVSADGWSIASRSESGAVFLELPLQAGASSSLLATLGILVLALLGGGLALRNRFPLRRGSPSSGVSEEPSFETDCDRVCALVQENGGRMRQSEIVDAVDWSKAKVSRLLADLEAEGRVTKLRLGRENLICLPGSEPTASRPPEPPNSE